MLTPQMEQALSVLQMNTMELNQCVEEELLSNPMLAEKEQKVERSYTVGIWQDGEKIGETAVTISGERSIWGRSYVGRFAIDAVEKTCRERMQAMIRWEKKSNCANITFAEPGFFGAQAGIEYFLYCDRKLNWFALSLEDGRIIASDQGWAQLQALRPYEYPVYVN